MPAEDATKAASGDDRGKPSGWAAARDKPGVAGKGLAK